MQSMRTHTEEATTEEPQWQGAAVHAVHDMLETGNVSFEEGAYYDANCERTHAGATAEQSRVTPASPVEPVPTSEVTSGP